MVLVYMVTWIPSIYPLYVSFVNALSMLCRSFEKPFATCLPLTRLPRSPCLCRLCPWPQGLWPCQGRCRGDQYSQPMFILLYLKYLHVILIYIIIYIYIIYILYICIWLYMDIYCQLYVFKKYDHCVPGSMWICEDKQVHILIQYVFVTTHHCGFGFSFDPFSGPEIGHGMTDMAPSMKREWMTGAEWGGVGSPAFVSFFGFSASSTLAFTFFSSFFSGFSVFSLVFLG